MTPNELMRAQREMRLTCEELAETVGFDVCAINHWRRGVSPVNPAAAERITALAAMPESEREKHIFRNGMKYSRAG
jgi:DNA-binding transcriptional regulator YiaG